MASQEENEESLYPIAVLIDELRNEDVQVNIYVYTMMCQRNLSLKNVFILSAATEQHPQIVDDSFSVGS